MRCLLIIWMMFVMAGCNLELDVFVEADTEEILPTPVIAYRDFSAPLSDPIEENLRAIFAYGQSRGNRADAFVMVGDSISVSASFLQAVGERREVLGAYADLAPIITRYRDGDVNSFSRRSSAAGVGWAAWGVLSSNLAGTGCVAGESPLACEYRLVRPSIALIMFGTNDAGYRTVGQYRADLTAILDMTIGMGIIPILSTPPPRPDTPGMIDGYRDVIRELGEAYQIPIWDYYALMVGLPNQGLAFDRIHPSTPPRGYEETVVFDAERLQYGYTVRNLSALMMLKLVHEKINGE